MLHPSKTNKAFKSSLQFNNLITAQQGIVKGDVQPQVKQLIHFPLMLAAMCIGLVQSYKMKHKWKQNWVKVV